MQNVQNAEIQQRVINLVELYRTKVGKESLIAQKAKKIYEKWKNGKKATEVNGIIEYSDIDNPNTEKWIRHLQVNEQLLGHFYQKVVGEEAETEVLSRLLPDFYNTTVFCEEEESFLSSHFMEMVNYIIQTPNNDLEVLNRYENKDEFFVPKEVLELIANQVQVPAGSVVFNPISGSVQLATLFKNCTFFCGGTDDGLSDAWLRVVAYANGVNTEIIDLSRIPKSYDVLLFYFGSGIPFSDGMDQLFCHMYNNLNDGGKIILIMPKFVLAKCGNKEERRFWHNLVDGREISKIIQLPNVLYSDNYNIILAEKKRQYEKTTFIDARFASVYGNGLFDLRRKMYWNTFDITSFKEMIKNDGRDSSREKKLIEIDSSSVDVNMLLPEFYLMKKPTNDDNPLPLSSICDYVKTKRISKLNFDLPLQTPWLRYSDLSYTFHGSINLEEIERANCPNNPKFSEGMETDFTKSGAFIDDYSHIIVNGTSKGRRICEYRNSSYMTGKKDVVFIGLGDLGAKTAIVPKSKTPYAADLNGYMTRYYAFTPNKGITSLELLALLRMPIVFNQIKLYSGFGDLACHLDEILVPFDEMIIRESTLRLECEEKEYKEQRDKLISMKTDYINEVRMRKHDMRPHLRQLASSERLMKHYIDNASDWEELKKNLRNQIEHSHYALENISVIVDHLSDEEKYGIPETLNIDKLLTDIEANHDDSEGFVIEYECDKESFRKHGLIIPDISEEWQQAKDKGYDIVKFIQKKSSDNIPLFIRMASVDFQRLIDNIIENARKHGFTDSSRDDYMIWINLSVDEKRDMYIIDFMNNGTPLPEGMSKARYGIKGEKAGLTGGTGSGGYIVKSIVTHYGGDYDILRKDNITIIRIYLPIATI